MPFSGAGVFNRVHNWVQDKIDGLKISATRVDEEFDNFRDGLSNTITRDGQTTIAADIPWNGKRLEDLGDAQADTDGLNRRSGDARFLTKAAGGTSAGDIAIIKPYPAVALTYGGGKRWDIQVRENGWLYFPEDGQTSFPIAITPGGNIWSTAFEGMGYLTSYVQNARSVGTAAQVSATAAQSTANGAYSYAASADANANNRVAKTGGTMSGDLIVSKGYPSVIHDWPGVRQYAAEVREDAYYTVFDNSAGAAALRVGPGGDLWCRQFGDVNTRIESRAASYAAYYADDRLGSANGYTNARTEGNFLADQIINAGRATDGISAYSFARRDGLGRVNANAPDGTAGSSAMVSADNRQGAWYIGNGSFGMAIDGQPYGVSFFYSDERYKDNIQDTDYDALGRVVQIPFKSFDIKPGMAMTGHWSCGVTAQSLRPVLPDCIITLPGEQGVLVPDTNRLLIIALRAVQQLEARLAAVEARST